MAKDVRLYSTKHCPFCIRAKSLLQSRNIPFQEIDLTDDPDTRDRLSSETGWMTVPMIFIGSDFIGGADDLQRLAQSGELDKKLK